jgi:hypothetical protein
MGGKGKKLEEQRIAVAPVVTLSRSSASLFSRFLVGSAIVSSLFVPNLSRADDNKAPVLVAKADGAKKKPQPPAPLTDDGKKVAVNATARTVSTEGGVANLKTYSVTKLKEMEAKMCAANEACGRLYDDGQYGPGTTATLSWPDGNYLRVGTGVDPATLEKYVRIEYPKERSNPAGESIGVDVSLKKLLGYYTEACTAEGREPKKNPWPKIIFNAKDAGVEIFTAFVDEKPKFNDSSDLKDGYPVLGRVYFKETNGVSVGEFYFRIESDDKVAMKQPH